MSTGALNISGIRQEMIITTGEITGHGKAESPQLWVPVSVAFVPFSGGERQPYESFELISVYAELTVTEANFRGSIFSMPLSFLIYQPTQYKVLLRFPVTRDILYYIEKYREGNLPCSVLLTFQVAHHEPPPKAKDGGNSIRPSLIRGFTLAQGDIKFQIEHSHWVTSILPGLGYNAGALVELPAVSILLPTEYANAIDEMKDARKYFDGGDYDKAVGHCRSALEPIKKQFSNIKKQLASDSRFTWLQTQFAATYDFIEQIVGSNYTIANKSHHPPSTGHFDRSDAETIIGITHLALARLGKILPS